MSPALIALIRCWSRSKSRPISRFTPAAETNAQSTIRFGMCQNAGGQPVVAVSRRGAARLRSGHVWVYRSDIVEAKHVPPGALVTVQELSDKPALSGAEGSVRPTRAHSTRTLGSALYSTASEIAVRMIS